MIFFRWNWTWRKNNWVLDRKIYKNLKIKKGYSCTKKKKKFKEIRQNFSQALISGRRIGSGNVVWEFYDDLVKLWGGSPATELLTCGISSKDINLPSCSSTSTSSSFSDGTNESDEDNNDKNIELTSSFKKPRKSSNPISQHLNNKHKHLEWQLREHSHIT